MPCSFELRHRDRHYDRPVEFPYRKLRLRMDGSTIAADSYHFTGIDLDHRSSIVDTHCVSDESSSEDRKDGCKECVKHSRQSYNMVRSEKTRWERPVGRVSLRGTIGPTTYVYEGSPIQAPMHLIDAKSHAQMPLKVPTQRELSQALKAITPSVDKFFPTVQIYETLFELKELRKLLNLFTVRKREAKVSEKYLGYQFGYLPLIRTIEDVLTILITLDNVIDKWNDFATSDRIMDFHGTISKEEGDGMFDVTVKHSSAIFIEHTDSIDYTWSTDSRLHLYIKPHIIPGDMRFRVLLKSLGIDKPIAGLWELVPFSWLIDYFVNVDDMIARWETGLNSMFTFHIHALGYSVKQKFRSKTVHKWNMIGGASPQAIGEEFWEFYERIPLPTSALKDAIIPDEWGWADGPTGQQWTYVYAVLPGSRRGVNI